MIVRLLPETARVWARSVSLKASSSSGVMREVSPTTSPGSSARASAGSPSVAVRSPARSRPANRCTAVGSPTVIGSACSRTRSTAAIRSPPANAGASRPVTRSRVDGSNSSHEARASARNSLRQRSATRPCSASAPPAPAVPANPFLPTNPADSGGPRTRTRPAPARTDVHDHQHRRPRRHRRPVHGPSTLRTSASISTESGVR